MFTQTFLNQSASKWVDCNFYPSDDLNKGPHAITLFNSDPDSAAAFYAVLNGWKEENDAMVNFSVIEEPNGEHSFYIYCSTTESVVPEFVKTTTEPNRRDDIRSFLQEDTQPRSCVFLPEATIKGENINPMYEGAKFMLVDQLRFANRSSLSPSDFEYSR